MGPAVAAALLLAADWSALERHQQTITRAEFDHLVATVYCPSGAFDKYLGCADNTVTVFSTPAKTNSLFTLRFADKSSTRFAPRIGRVVLDPGHIGGAWAQFEGRHFARGDDKPVEEAALNLNVARLVKTQLEDGGLTVFLTKNNFEPLTGNRPPDARFDIAARARRINDEFKPDLTVCIHFNAAPWNSRRDLVASNRLGVFVHGNYLPDEVADDEMKFFLMSKLLERSHNFELSVADAVARSLARATGLPPLGASDNSVAVRGHRYLLLRNLGMSRRTRGPVIYLEPYFMNNATVYERLQLGDYDGWKKIGGRNYRSIFREYADAVAEALVPRGR